MAECPPTFALVYGVELLCETKPLVDKRVLLTCLQEQCPQAIRLSDDDASAPSAFVHTDHPVHWSARTFAAQTFVAVADERLDKSKLQPALEQSRGAGALESVIARCDYSVLVTDFLAATLDHRERLALFLRALAGVLGAIPCLAIHWMPSQQISDPEVFRNPVGLTDSAGLFAGPLNVRFHRVSNKPGDMVMDTLGLAALGLPDVQCHFRKLDPTRVSRVVGNVGYYLLQNGDIIKDRKTVKGPEHGERWVCQREKALVPPEREVLDLDPGGPFAADDQE